MKPHKCLARRHFADEGSCPQATELAINSGIIVPVTTTNLRCMHVPQDRRTLPQHW